MSGISEQDIEQAYHELKQEGVNPTQARVRAKLGRGSNSQISPVLRRLREHEGNGATGKYFQLEELPLDILELFQRTWTKAVITADERIVTEQVEQLEQECDRLHQDLHNYKATKQELEGLRSGFNVVLAQLSELTRQNERLLQFKDQAEQFEAVKNQRDAFIESNTAFSQDVDHLQKENRQLRETLEIEDRKAAVVEAELINRNEQVRSLSAQVLEAEELRSQLETVTAQNEILRHQLAESDHNSLPSEEGVTIADLQRVVQQLEKTNKKLQSQLWEQAKGEDLGNGTAKSNSKTSPKTAKATAKPNQPRSKRKLLEGDQLPLPGTVQESTVVE